PAVRPRGHHYQHVPAGELEPDARGRPLQLPPGRVDEGPRRLHGGPRAGPLRRPPLPGAAPAEPRLRRGAGGLLPPPPPPGRGGGGGGLRERETTPSPPKRGRGVEEPDRPGGRLDSPAQTDVSSALSPHCPENGRLGATGRRRPAGAGRRDAPGQRADLLVS